MTSVATVKQRFAENQLPIFLLKGARYPFKPLLAPGAVAAFKRRRTDVKDVAQAVEFAKRFKWGGITIQPWQIDPEITSLLRVLEENPPRRILDIGTASGGLLYLFTCVAAPDATLVSIDLPHGLFGGGYPAWRAPLYRAFARDNQHIELLRADSHDPRTLEAVKKAFGGDPVDFLFIDGDHRYEGVKADFEMYGPLVRDSGVVAFHDIIPGSPEYVGGVPDYWQELKRGREASEFVDDWNRGSCGIGVLRNAGALQASSVVPASS
jgi:predicted O-methyltransferase YrrM